MGGLLAAGGDGHPGGRRRGGGGGGGGGGGHGRRPHHLGDRLAGRRVALAATDRSAHGHITRQGVL